MTSAHAELRAVFDGFADHTGPAYFHIGGDLSFRDLHQSALSLASRLISLDENRSPVVILGHKDKSFQIAYWACLLAGRPLIPVESDTPDQRLSNIIESCKATLVLSIEPNVAPPRLSGVACWSMHDLPVQTSRSLEGCIPTRADGDIAYIMFSSGSTGRPKGIKITYANLADFVRWLRTDLLSQIDFEAVSGTVRHCFDVSLFELWSSWLRCKPISALDHGEFINSRKYIERFGTHNVGLWVSTPSTAQIYLKDKTFDAKGLPRLKTFLFCGELLSKELVQTLENRFPQARIINTYGPTECTVAVTSVTINAQHIARPGPLPIGRARAGTKLSVQNGQIAIEGASVGAGYVNMPEKTKSAFPSTDTYLSGDGGSCDDNGLWYFSGRMDREIKLLGMRMDLSEIEATIMNFDGVTSAFIEPVEIRGVIRSLRVYVNGPHSIDDLPQIAQDTAAILAPAMVPKFWHLCPELRLNQNSKIDKPRTIEIAAQCEPFVFNPLNVNAKAIQDPPPPSHDVTETALDGLGFLKCAEIAVKRHGSMVTLALPRGGRNLTLLSDAKHVRFWRENEALFVKDHKIAGSGAAAMRSVLGNALQTSCVGENWAEFRKEMTGLLNTSKDWFLRPLSEATTQLAADLTAPNAPRLDKVCLDWATKAICDPLFRNSALNAPALDLLTELDGNLFQRMAAIEPDQSDTLIDAQIDKLLHQIADGARSGSITDTVLQDDSYVGSRDEKLRRIVAGLLAASLHMNAMTLFWALVHIAEQPDLQQRIADEARPFGLAPRRIAQTPVAFATLRETLRVKPVTAFLERQVATAFSLDGFRFEAGQSVLFSPLLVHMDNEQWDHATQFDPDRFLNGRSYPKDSYLPFGMGSRVCPGANAVNQQLTYAISGLCQMLTLDHDPNTRPGDLKQMFKIVLEPRGIVKLNATRRFETAKA
ncbi:MAG: cytochrome P450 [Aliishimia sp.]